GAPAFGGNQRTIVITVSPERLKAYRLSAEEVIAAVASGNVIIPGGDIRTGDLDRLGTINSVVENIQDLQMLPLRKGPGPTVFLRDVGKIEDSSDILTGYALVNGRRTVYLPVVKLPSASTLSVVQEVKAALPKMREAVPADVHIDFVFDQSVFVTRAIKEIVSEGMHGTLLTGLMVLLFLRDIRSALIVVTSIPFALLCAVVALWLTGQTINIMTLGGLALAIGILVDEATVTIENIHTHFGRGEPLARAVLLAGRETVTPRFLAMLSVVSVFVPSFFMEGATRALFVPLSLAVGFSMFSSYILSSTMVPVLATWIIKHKHAVRTPGRLGLFFRFRNAYTRVLGRLMSARLLVIPCYAAAAFLIILLTYPALAQEIFPTVDMGQFEIKLRAPTGTRFEKTTDYALQALEVIASEAGGAQNIDISIGYAGTQPPDYALSDIYTWTSGPHEAVLTVALREGAKIPLEPFKERLRKVIPEKIPQLTVSFEAGDIISKIMNFGAPTPIEIAITGTDLALDRFYADKLIAEMRKIPILRDVEFGQPLDYPSLDVKIDRERAGQLGVTMEQVGRSLVAATSSSRWVQQNYWRDPKSGIAYQVQVQMPQYKIGSLEEVGDVPVMPGSQVGPYVRDLAKVTYGVHPGEIDHHNQFRLISITANIAGDDLGRAARQVQAAIDRAGKPPRGVFVAMRGQVPPMKETFTGLMTGLLLAIGVILLMLTANFQSVPLALVVLCVIPAIVSGEVVALMLTDTTVNVQSFMGAIMAIGVGVSNAILLMTFAEQNRMSGQPAVKAALNAGRARLRPVLMTSIAMIAGMVPMAISQEAQASLARAVIGGLLLSTPTVLLVLPLIFSIVQRNASRVTASIHPDDIPAERSK
ncbi:MAG TPA: efflux RND transporter permease subunit, partial [Candidatus Obscuribacterales bacterium]